MATQIAHHLVDQVAADGYEGSSLERLNSFIQEFTKGQDDTANVLDDALRNFILSLLLQHPSVRAGSLQVDIITAYKEEQQKAKNASKAQKLKDEAVSDDDDDARFIAKIIKVSSEDQDLSLEELVAKHGSTLRFVAEKDAILAAVAGSQRDLNISQKVFLSLVSREREQGASFPYLCERLETYIGNIFFHLTTLTKKGLLAKFKKKIDTGSLVNVVLLRRYVHLCPQLAEEDRDDSYEHEEEGSDEDEEETIVKEEEEETDGELMLRPMSSKAFRALDRAVRDDQAGVGDSSGIDEEEDEDEEDYEDADHSPSGGTEPAPQSSLSGDHEKSSPQDHPQGILTKVDGLLAFPDIIDKLRQEQLLHDTTRLRLRILQLLSACRNRATITRGIANRLGFVGAKKRHSKACFAQIRILDSDGCIELCLLPFPLLRTQDHKERAIRLLEPGLEYLEMLRSSAQQKEVRRSKALFTKQLTSTQSHIHLETPIERQLLECISRSGESGITIDAIHSLLGGSHEMKRVLDHFLSAAKLSPIPQYRDLTITSALHQNHRVRSSRFWALKWDPRTGSEDTEPIADPLNMPLETILPSSQVLQAEANHSDKNQPAKLIGRPPGSKNKKRLRDAEGEADHDSGACTSDARTPEKATKVTKRVKPLHVETPKEAEPNTKSTGENALEEKKKAASRSNLTMIEKEKVLLAFFEKVGVIDSPHMEREFTSFLNKRDIPPEKRWIYEMDRKVRSKLLAKLEQDGKIVRKRIIGPPAKQKYAKPRMVELFHLRDLDSRKIADYGRAVSNGELEPLNVPSAELGDRYSHSVLQEGDVDVPDRHFYHLDLTLEFRATNLEELLSETSCRDQLIANDEIRCMFTGRLVGFASRMQFLHRQTMSMLANSDEPNHFVEGNMVVDMLWWSSHVTLQHYLRLAIPPPDNEVLEASQNASLKSKPLSDLSSDIRLKLGLENEATGCQDTIAPLLRDLCALGLVVAVKKRSEDSFAETEWTPQHTLYRFIAQVSPLQWNSKQELLKGDLQINLMQDQARRLYWSRLDADKRYRGTSDLDSQFSRADLEPDFSQRLGNTRSWTRLRHVHPLHEIFFNTAEKFGVESEVVDDLELLEKLSYASVMPIRSVQRYFERLFKTSSNLNLTPREEHRYPAPPVRSLLGRRTRGRAANLAMGPLTKRQTVMIRRKARKALADREEEFDRIVLEFWEQHEIKIEDQQRLERSLLRARRAYANRSPSMTKGHLEHLMANIVHLHTTGRCGSFSTLLHKTTAGSRSKMLQRLSGKDDASLVRDEKGRKTIFEWDRERDERLRDAGVILRARDKYRSLHGVDRKNWAAMKSVFPGVNPSALHTRFSKLQAAIGEEAYLDLLEKEWTKLWTAHRGTDVLPDTNPMDAVEGFDLLTHIRFLRNNLDKTELFDILRRGTDESLPLNADSLDVVFDYERPHSLEVEQIAEDLIIRRKAGDTVGDAKVQQLRRTAVSIDMFSAGNGMQPDTSAGEAQSHAKAEQLLKMMSATEDACYNEIVASKLALGNVLPEAIVSAREELRSAHIIKESIPQDGPQPSRMLSWSTEWQAFMDDSNLETISLWEILSNVREVLPPQTSKTPARSVLTISGDSNDLDTAAGILLADEGRISLEIDTEPLASFGSSRLFNGKKLTDAQLELPVHLSSKRRKHDEGKETTNAGDRLLSKHRSFKATMEGDLPAERVSAWLESKETEGHLYARWDKAMKAFTKTKAGKAGLKDADQLQKILFEAGSDGVSRDDLRRHFALSEQFAQLISDMLICQPPLAFCPHPKEAKLVATAFLVPWTVQIAVEEASRELAPPDLEEHRVLPRPWLDIFGNTNRGIWRHALALILHAVITQPGAPLAMLVRCMRQGGLTRSDVVCLVDYSCEKGLLQKQWSLDPDVVGPMVDWLATNDEEVALSYIDFITGDSVL